MHSGYPSINHRLTVPTWQGPDEEAAERRVVCVVLNIGEERAIVLGVRYGDIRRSSGQLCCGLNKWPMSIFVFSFPPPEGEGLSWAILSRSLVGLADFENEQTPEKFSETRRKFRTFSRL